MEGDALAAGPERRDPARGDRSFGRHRSERPPGQAPQETDPERDLAAWIYTIARRTAIDIYRKRSKVTPSDTIEIAVHAPGLETAWETFEVRSALDQLPDDERNIIRLSHFAGLSHQEIADHLGIPIGTVKSRSYRAHQKLIGLLRHVVET